MPSGRVKWFDSKKGYGFITRENGDDIFVHFSDIESDGYKTLDDGDSVDFTVADGEKGKQAKEVKLK